VNRPTLAAAPSPASSFREPANAGSGSQPCQQFS
jgi:hypothetical protein